MDKSILNAVYRQWLAAKEEAVRMCQMRNLDNFAESIRRCDMFKGDESFADLTRLFKTPQAIEFCIRYNFPNLATLRVFKSDNPECYGIYIDKGTITLDDPEDKVILIGRTTAVVNCHKLKKYNIVCMHGANSIINASGWSVVHVDAARNCVVTRNIKENAVIL